MSTKHPFFILILTCFIAGAHAQDCNDVTLGSITDPGPYNIGTMVEADGLRDGPDYQGASVYFPTNGTPPYPSIVLSPGYFSTQASVKDWGPFYASHGIIAMTIGTNSLFDYPDERAAGLLDAIETLRQENTRSGSPLEGQIDVTNFAVSGWSMGGGGAQRAAAMDGSLKAVVALCPWLSTSSTTPSDLDHDVPVLIFSGQSDPTAPPSSHANVHYNYTPATTDKLKYEVQNGNHSVANGPYGGGGSVGKVALSWLRYFMQNDPCYCDLLLETPNSASSYTTNVECSKIITASQDALSGDSPNIFPNPAGDLLHVELNTVQPVKYALINVLGETVRLGEIQNGAAQVDLTGLSPDLYLLYLEGRAFKVLKAF